MDKATEHAWILMAIGYASAKQAADFAAISLMANKINYGAPNHVEMQQSVTWLLMKNLIVKNDKRYTLSKSGSAMLEQAREGQEKLPAIWDALKNLFEQESA